MVGENGVMLDKAHQVLTNLFFDKIDDNTDLLNVKIYL